MSIIDFILGVIDAYIICPLKKIYNYYIKHIYIPDNPRNHELLNYFIDVINDNSRQPETPTEVYFENLIKDDFMNFAGDNEGNFPTEEDWINERPSLYCDMAKEMLEYKWIKED